MSDRYSQISVSDEFINVIDKASVEAGTSFLSFIKLAVIRMANKDSNYRTESIINLQIAETSWGKEKIKKTIRLKEFFKTEVVDSLVVDFGGNSSLLYRASAFSLSQVPRAEMKSEIRIALTESIKKQYGITLK